MQLEKLNIVKEIIELKMMHQTIAIKLQIQKLQQKLDKI